MSNFKKHIDVVASIEEFQTNLDNGIYYAPWVVYVSNADGGYTILTSNTQDENITLPDVFESLSNRINKLEEEKVYCLEEEYNELIEKGTAWITDIDGTRKEVVFNSEHLYFIYKEEETEPTEPKDEIIPEEPENTLKNEEGDE